MAMPACAKAGACGAWPAVGDLLLPRCAVPAGSDRTTILQEFCEESPQTFQVIKVFRQDAVDDGPVDLQVFMNKDIAKPFASRL